MATYSDKELATAAKIGYMDLGKAYESLCNETRRTNFTLRELLDWMKDSGNSKYNNVINELNGISEYLDKWSISGVHDTNYVGKNNEPSNGFYGCIIDTGDGNAIVSFRGSEGMGTSKKQISNIENDWIGSDIHLVDSVPTPQQKEAERFMEEYADVLNKYNKVDLTGHSLGGNLAEYSMIVAGDGELIITDKDGNTRKVKVGGNFERCVSLDGPGYSDEFMEAYQDKIKKNADRIDHYHWSFVSGMLNDVPGANNVYIKVKNEAMDDHILSGSFTRHSLDSVEFDENGNVIEGKRDFLSYLSDGLSNLVDDLPQPLGSLVVNVVGSVLLFGFEHPEEFITIVVSFAISHPILTAGVIAFALSVIVFEYAKELFDRVIDSVVEWACSLLRSVSDWAANLLDSFCAGVRSIVGEIKNWFRNIFDGAYREAQQYLSHSYVISVNTDRLRDLISQLRNINNRLNDVSWRIFNTKNMGESNISLIRAAQVQFGVAWSEKLDGCIKYLESTAERFDNAESNIISMMG